MYWEIKQVFGSIRDEIEARSGQIWREVFMFMFCTALSFALIQHAVWIYGGWDDSLALSIPWYWYIVVAGAIYGAMQTVVFYFINRVFEEASKEY